eukprot:820361-Pleurochrysis_carterae.AAC.2
MIAIPNNSTVNCTLGSVRTQFVQAGFPPAAVTASPAQQVDVIVPCFVSCSMKAARWPFA